MAHLSPEKGQVQYLLQLPFSQQMFPRRKQRPQQINNHVVVVASACIVSLFIPFVVLALIRQLPPFHCKKLL